MTHSILIVDDTAENIDMLKGILMDEYDVKAALNGMAALKIASKFKPDLILLDIMMPDMDGYEVCRKLKENPVTSHIPVIFVTAMTDENDEALGFEAGCVDYITKPIQPMIVRARVKNHLILSDQQIALDIKVEQMTKDLLNNRRDLIQRLGRASEYRDSDTGQHILRVSKYTELIARKMGLSMEEVGIIKCASPMHDVGKIGIDDDILKKPGKYTDEEYNKMKKHCEIGEDILKDPEDRLLQAAAIIAGQHHERWNGSGYPRGLKGEEIHLYARICAIADVFDALTSERPYKKAWNFNDAFQYILKNEQNHFDPSLVTIFESLFDDLKNVHDSYID